MRCYRPGIIGKRAHVGIVSSTDTMLVIEGKKFLCTFSLDDAVAI